MPSLLAVIVNYRSAALAIKCVASLVAEKEQVPDLQVQVIENDSGDFEVLSEALNKPEYHSWVRLVRAEKNGGFAYGNNLAVRSALKGSDPPQYFLLLNPDTEVRPGAIQTLIDFMNRTPRAGIAGSQLENADGSLWKRAFRFPNILGELNNGMNFGPVSRLLEHYCVVREMGELNTQVDWLPGAAMIVRRDVYEQVGLMDESYFLYYEETDFCLAAQRAGWECWYVPAALVMHVSGQSTGVTAHTDEKKRLPDYWFESRRRFFVKNFGVRYAAMSDIAYGLGLGFCRARTMLTKKKSPLAPRMLYDMLRHSVLLPKNRGLVSPPKF